MPDAFFATSTKKRKRSGTSTNNTNTGSARKFARTSSKPHPKPHLNGKAKTKGPARDEELSSASDGGDIDDMDLRAEVVDENESDREEDVRETAAEKRLRLARIYLEGVKEGVRAENEFDAAEIDREIISARLKEDVLENAGKVHVFIASSLSISTPTLLRLKPHRLAITSAVLSPSLTHLYTSGKEGAIACSDLSFGKRVGYKPKLRTETKGKGKGKGKGRMNEEMEGHGDEVLSVAVSGDGKWLVSGGRDRRVCVWDISGEEGSGEGKMVWVKAFGGHKDSVVALSFRKSTNSLYSASSDRTLRVYDLSPSVMGYVETLFGHQEAITSLDSLRGDTAISSGGRDRTIRFWKIADETQLVFRGGGTTRNKLREVLEGGLEGEEEEEDIAGGNVKRRRDLETWAEGSVDCVAMVDEGLFLSGGDSGSICLWSTNKKKPIFTFTLAHGLEEIESSTEGTLRRPRWVTSLAALRYGDVFASGSWDGHIRLWKLDASLRSFTRLGSLSCPGIINSLQVTLIPKGWDVDKKWTQTQGELAPRVEITPNGVVGSREEGVLVVAGVGQEPRLGRWLKLKGEGVVNSAVVLSIRRV